MILTRITYVTSGLIYLTWVVSVLIGFWTIDVYMMKFPLWIELGVTAPAIVLAFMAFSFIHTGFSKNKLPQ